MMLTVSMTVSHLSVKSWKSPKVSEVWNRLLTLKASPLYFISSHELYLIVFGGKKKGSWSHYLKKPPTVWKLRPTDNLKIWCETFWHAEEVMLNTYVSKLVSFAWDSLLGLKLSFDLYTSVILCIRMSSSYYYTLFQFSSYASIWQ